MYFCNAGKVAGYEINIHTSEALLYINDELSEREIKKTITFTIATTTKKVPRNKLTQGVTQILAQGILCCGCSTQIHTDYRNPVEKGWRKRDGMTTL